MAAHVLVYQYIMETWVLMRLRRLQGHINRLHEINVENHADLAKVTGTSEAEAKAFAAQQVAHETHVRVDYLLTQSTKRIHNIHLQIAMYRVALADKMKIKFDIEERRRRLIEMTRFEETEEEIQALSEKDASRTSGPRPSNQSN